MASPPLLRLAVLGDIRLVIRLDLVRADLFRGEQGVGAQRDVFDTRFQGPEEVGVEYIALSTHALLASEQVGADEIKSYYESNISKYGEPEQRRASPIPI